MLLTLNNLTRPIIVIHPDKSQRLSLFAQFQRHGAIYFKLDMTATSTLATQFEALSNTIAQQANFKYLILDECDQLTSEEIVQLIEELLPSIQTAQIVICGRNVPEFVYTGSSLSQQIYLIRFGEIISPPSTPHIYASGFGTGQIYLNGQPLDLEAHLRDFVFYALHKVFYKDRFTRDNYANEFVPHLSHKEAIADLNKCYDALQSILGANWLLKHKHEFRLNPDYSFTYDVTRHRALLGEIIDNQARSMMVNHNSANFLYKNDFLTSSDNPWVIKQRDKLRKDQLIVIKYLSQCSQQTHRQLGYLFQAYSMNNKREDIQKAIIEYYVEQGYPDEALVAYQSFRDNLHPDTLSPDIDDLINGIEGNPDQ